MFKAFVQPITKFGGVAADLSSPNSESEDEPPPHDIKRNNNGSNLYFINELYIEILIKDWSWCGTPVSNRRPSAWQADALPTELVPQLRNANIPLKDKAFNHKKVEESYE